MAQISEVPSRWDVEVRVMTPDHQVLTTRQTYSPDYMDQTLLETLLDELIHHVSASLKKRGYYS
jgi:hypothetical protein